MRTHAKLLRYELLCHLGIYSSEETMKNIDGDMAKTPVTQRVKDLDTEIEDVIKTAEKESSVDRNDRFRIWHCNGVPVGVHLHKKP